MGRKEKARHCLRNPLLSWVFMHGFLSLFKSHIKPEVFATEHLWFEGKGFLIICFVKAEK